MLDVTIVAHDIGSVGGGMEVQLAELVQGLLDRDVAVTVIARRCELAPRPGLTVHRVRTPTRPFPIAYPAFAIAGSWLTRRRSRGVVHVAGAILLSRVDCVTVHFCHAAYDAAGLGSRPAAPGRLFALSAWLSTRLSLWGNGGATALARSLR